MVAMLVATGCLQSNQPDETLPIEAVETQGDAELQDDSPSLAVFGEIETVRFPPHETGYEARIDTGAKTSSLHAVSIEPFLQDGEQWVRFQLVGRGELEPVEFVRPVTRTAVIRKSGGVSTERYVAAMTLQIGELVMDREFTLANRENMDFAVLIGRNVLDGVAVVDVSQAGLIDLAPMDWEISSDAAAPEVPPAESL